MKKIIDSNGRLFGLISAIDVAVILVAVVTAAALWMKFGVLDKSSPSAPVDRITYELTVTNMPEGRLTSLREGDCIYDKDNDSGSPVGVITGIRYEDCRLSSSKVDGTYVMAAAEGRYNVTITVQAAGRVDPGSGRTFINRTNEVEVGMSNNYYTKACLFMATVTALEQDGV